MNSKYQPRKDKLRSLLKEPYQRPGAARVKSYDNLPVGICQQVVLAQHLGNTSFLSLRGALIHRGDEALSVEDNEIATPPPAKPWPACAKPTAEASGQVARNDRRNGGLLMTPGN